jgi:sugar phosphate isomerase/epimerase
MKFGFSLETVNIRASEPNFKHKLSKTFWDSMFKFIASAGFEGIEMPYTPYVNGIVCDICRSGMPISRYAIDTKYSSPEAFMHLLNSVGIKEVSGIHINPNDTLNELIEMSEDTGVLFTEFEKLAEEAIQLLVELGSKTLLVSATPEIGLILETGPQPGWETPFRKQSITMLNRIAEKAHKSGIQTVVKNEFWGLARGNAIDWFMKELDPSVLFSPDLANIKIAGSDILETMSKYKNRLSSIRLNDTFFTDVEENYSKTDPEIPVVGAQRVFCDLGDGDIEIPAIYKELVKAGYDGWIICESRKTLNIYRALLKMRWYLDHVLAGS